MSLDLFFQHKLKNMAEYIESAVDLASAGWTFPEIYIGLAQQAFCYTGYTVTSHGFRQRLISASITRLKMQPHLQTAPFCSQSILAWSLCKHFWSYTTVRVCKLVLKHLSTCQVFWVYFLPNNLTLSIPSAFISSRLLSVFIIIKAFLKMYGLLSDGYAGLNAALFTPIIHKSRRKRHSWDLHADLWRQGELTSSVSECVIAGKWE